MESKTQEDGGVVHDDFDDHGEGDGTSEESDFIGFSPVRKQENAKVDCISEVDILQANAMAKQLHVYKPGIDFVPGAKLEVLDTRDNNWYQCRVVEVDWGELDILVHYERWSVRFDEWLKMDSTRIKPYSNSPSKEQKKPVYKVGEKVLGYWAPDSKYYLGQIIKHSSEGCFEVLFYDGYSKALRSTQLKKLNPKEPLSSYCGMPRKPIKGSPGTPVAAQKDPSNSEPGPPRPRRISLPLESIESPPPTPPPPSEEKLDVEQGNVAALLHSPTKRNIFDVEILEEKRKTKRKPDVEELFKSLKKKRKFEEMDESEKLVQVKQQQKPVQIKQQQKPVEIKLQQKGAGKEADSPSLNVTKATKPKTEHTSSGSERMPPKGCSYFEIEIGHGWKKVCMRRTQGVYIGKWDVFYMTAESKKIRTRQELIKYCEEEFCPLNPVELDFSVRSAMFKYEAIHSKSLADTEPISLPSKEPKNDPVLHPPKAVHEQQPSVACKITDIKKEDDKSDENDNSTDDESLDESEDSSEDDLEGPGDSHTEDKESNSSSDVDSESNDQPDGDESVPCVKLNELYSQKTDKDVVQLKQKVSTKVEISELENSDAKNAATSTGFPTNPLHSRNSTAKKISSYSSSDSPSKSENSHKCPKKTCEKSFRKENLLQMHMKHYHPELLKRRSLQAPNVADLAYARTVGDHLDAASQSPSSLSFPSVGGFLSPDKSSKAEQFTRTTRLSASFESRKSSDKKGHSGSNAKEHKRKDAPKTSQQEASDSEEENELMEYVNDLKEEATINTESGEPQEKMDPDYMPGSKISSLPKKSDKQQRDRRISRSENKGRKSRKSVSESLDPEEETPDAWPETQTASDSQDAIIHCGCKSQEEDGLMLQCDVCLCWQHGSCYNIENEDQVPDKYICSLCENPRGQRSSMRFRHHQEWLKEGKLPRFSFSTSEPDTKLESFIRRGHDLSANVLQLSQLISSLKLKLNISKETDHPKFVMWHKKWDEPSDEDQVDKTVENQNLNQQSEPVDPPVLPVQELISTFESQAVIENTGIKNTFDSFMNPVSLNDETKLISVDTGSTSVLNTKLITFTDKETLPAAPVSLPENAYSENGGRSSNAVSRKEEEIVNENKIIEQDISEQDKENQNLSKEKEAEMVMEETNAKEEVHQYDHSEVSEDKIFEDKTSNDIAAADVIKNKNTEINKESLSLEISNVKEENKEIKESLTLDEIKVENVKTETSVNPDVSSEVASPSQNVCEGPNKETDDGAAQVLKSEVDNKEEKIPPLVETATQDPLDDPEDFDLELGGFEGNVEADVNDGSDFVDLLSSNPVLDHLVELAPLEHHPIPVPRAPIIPEAERIEPVNCKLNLLTHVEQMQNKVFKRYDLIESQLQALEAEMGLTSEIFKEEEELLASEEGEERDAATLQARSVVQLILKDIDIVKKLSDFAGP